MKKHVNQEQHQALNATITSTKSKQSTTDSLVDNSAKTQKAAQLQATADQYSTQKNVPFTDNRQQTPVIQAKIVSGKLNVVGEDHGESVPRRTEEKNMIKEVFGMKNYWAENEFKTGKPKHIADPFELRFLQLFDLLVTRAQKPGAQLYPYFTEFEYLLGQLNKKKDGKELSKNRKKFYKELEEKLERWSNIAGYDKARLREELQVAYPEIRQDIAAHIGLEAEDVADQGGIAMARSVAMHEAANTESGKQVGVWKVGQQHIEDMTPLEEKQYELTSQDEFNDRYNAYLEKS